MKDDLMTVGEHIKEARKQIAFCLIIWGILFILFYILSPEILKTIVNESKKMGLDIRMLSPVEIIVSGVNLATVSALVLTAPFALVSLASYLQIRIKKGLLIAPFTAFITGAVCGVRFLVYAAVRLFIKVSEGQGLRAEFTLEKALSFLLSAGISCGTLTFVFSLLLLLVRRGIVGSAILKKIRPAVYPLAFLLAAFMTPPDIFSMIAVALPLLAVYEVCTLGALLKSKKSIGETKKDEKTDNSHSSCP